MEAKCFIVSGQFSVVYDSAQLEFGLYAASYSSKASTIRS